MRIIALIKLMYITNSPRIAKIAESAGVDRIFVDMESLNKQERQGCMDTVQSHHTVADVASIRAAITKAELLVRCNPIHEACHGYCSSEQEIEELVQNGADMIMLPYFKTVEEVRRFLSLVNGRVSSFQDISGLPMTGNLDKHTWKHLVLQYPLAANLNHLQP